MKFARTGRFRLKLDGRRLTVTDSSDGVTIRAKLSEWVELNEAIQRLAAAAKRSPPASP